MIRMSRTQLSFLDHLYGDSLAFADRRIRGIGDDWAASRSELQWLDFKETPDTAIPLEVRATRNLGKARKEFLTLAWRMPRASRTPRVASSCSAFVTQLRLGRMPFRVFRQRIRRKVCAWRSITGLRLPSRPQSTNARSTDADYCSSMFQSAQWSTPRRAGLTSGGSRTVASRSDPTRCVRSPQLGERTTGAESYQTPAPTGRRRRLWRPRPTGCETSDKTSCSASRRRSRAVLRVRTLGPRTCPPSCGAAVSQSRERWHLWFRSAPSWRPHQARQRRHRLAAQRGRTTTAAVLLIEDVLARLAGVTKTDAFRVGAAEVRLIDFEPDVLRELVANGFAHRDWEQPGMIDIAHSPDGLVPASPGDLLPTLNTDRLLRESAQRNRVLSREITRLRIAEGAEMGFDRVYRSLAAAGKEPPRIEVGPRFTVDIPGGQGDRAFARFLEAGVPGAPTGRRPRRSADAVDPSHSSLVTAAAVAPEIQRDPNFADEVLTDADRRPD